MTSGEARLEQSPSGAFLSHTSVWTQVRLSGVGDHDGGNKADVQRTSMEDTMNHQHSSPSGSIGSFLRSPTGLVLIAFLAIAGFYLVTEHTAHVFGFLPYALILLCPIMHLLMHGSHGGHGGHGGHEDHSAHQTERSDGEQR